MKLDVLETIEIELNDAIVAEKAKIEAAKKMFENALKDALNKPEIGRGKKLPTCPFDENKLDKGRALNIVMETRGLTKNGEIMAECELLFEQYGKCGRIEVEAYRRIVWLTKALNGIKAISIEVAKI